MLKTHSVTAVNACRLYERGHAAQWIAFRTRDAGLLKTAIGPFDAQTHAEICRDWFGKY